MDPLIAMGMAVALGSAAARFEASPAPGQTYARPADGETLDANPPCFVYPAREVHDAYVVQVSREPSFPEARTSILESPWMLAVPTHALESGSHWWRWRPKAANEWSCVRQFTVPADVPVVAFPDLNRLLADVSSRHPRVNVTADGVKPIREKALEQFGADWLDRVRRDAERARAQSLLPEPDFLPDRRDPSRRELYQKTFRTTRPFFRDMARLAQDYLLSANPLSGQEARRRLLHIIAWDPNGSTSIGHNDEPATEVIRYAPTVYDRVHDLLTELEREQCLNCLTTRMQDMMRRWTSRPFEKHPYESHNMGYYLPDMLEASIALVGDAPVQHMLHYTLLQLWSPFYPPFGGKDGGWSEGPSYWGWSTAVFARTYRLVERTTGIPVHQRSPVRNMARYKLYGNPPYFKMSPFGDGHEGRAGGGATMAMLASLYRDPYAKWYTLAMNAHLTGLDALLFDSHDLQAQDPMELPQARAFFDVGLAAMHTALSDADSNVAVLMRSSPFGSTSHAYADQNTFVLDAYGEPLIIASGYYQLYGHPHHAKWTWQTQASNSVLVNGEGQTPRSWEARGRLVTFRTTRAGHYAKADATDAYAGRLTRFHRQVVFLRPIHTEGEPVIVIRDVLQAPEPATYQFLLHALNQIDIEPEAQRLTIAKGKARCRVDYLAPAELRFSQHDQFPEPPIRGGDNQWHLTASTVKPVSAIEAVAVLQPSRADEPVPMLSPKYSADAHRTTVTLEDAKRSIRVVFRHDEPADGNAVAQLSTDADVASVSSRHGTVRSAVMFHGTTLEQDGAALLRHSTSGSSSCSRDPDGRGWQVAGDFDTDKADVMHFAAMAPIALTQKLSLHTSADMEPPPDVWLDVAAGERTKANVTWFPRTRKLIIAATPRTPGGSYSVNARLANEGTGQLPVTLKAGTHKARGVLAPGEQAGELAMTNVPLGDELGFILVGAEARGGKLAVRHLECRRIRGVNLLPHASFEAPAPSGDPAGWKPASITNGANCQLRTVEGGRGGGRCLEVTCSKATGGDFGAMLSWAGLPPSSVARRFRMSCWVKTDNASRAGLQVTSRNWKWWKNTERLNDRATWSEAALELVLPAETDLTHVRLHMNSTRLGAKLYVDDIELVELPMDGRQP